MGENMYKRFVSEIDFFGPSVSEARLATAARAWSRSAGRMKSLIAFMF